MWNVSPDPLDFEEAIAWHRRRVPLTKEQWLELDQAARRKAFTVAGVAQLELVTTVWNAIDRALAEGTTLAEFKQSVGDKLRAAWQGSVDSPAWRLETIFRTNIQLAYSAGRHAQATHPRILDARPYWMFDATLDSRTSEICAACDGTVRPAADAWWDSHQPPLHHNCRSTFITLTEEQAAEQGLSKRAPITRAASGFGAAPTKDEWEPDSADYPKELWAAYRAKRT